MNEESIFTEALNKSTSAERSAYLDEACRGDGTLRQHVEELIAAHAEVGEFLSAPALEQVERAERQGDMTATFTGKPEGGDADQTFVESSAVQTKSSYSFLASPTRPGSVGRLAHYEMLEVLGKGGFGTVFKAFDTKLHRVVAIKVLAPELASNGAARKRFLREAHAAAAVRHEHVVVIHAIEEQPLPYIVMECIIGQTLQEKLDDTGPLPLKEILRIGMQIAEGLAAAHKQGLVHRDIKPANVLLENGIEQVKITDFGLARAVDDASVTQSGVVAGTPMYMSPEQAEGATIDHRSDLFSLGTVLYAMCTGKPPFRASGTMAVLRRVIDDTPRPIRESNTEIPEWFGAIVEKLHAKKPEERYQTAREVADLLAKCLSDMQVHGQLQPSGIAAIPPTHAAPGPSAVRRGRKFREWATAAIVILAGLAVVVWRVWLRDHQDKSVRDGSTTVRVTWNETRDHPLSVALEDQEAPNHNYVVGGPGATVAAVVQERGNTVAPISRSLRGKALLRPGAYRLRASEDGVEFHNGIVQLVAGKENEFALPAPPSLRPTPLKDGTFPRPEASLKMLALAMHSYHEANGGFPTPANTDKNGSPLLSWRVHLLPFIEQNDLYKQFKLDEPWDSPHNIALIAKIPAVYGMGVTDSSGATDGKTSLVVPVGKDTIFPGTKGVKLEEIANGPSNTVLILQGDDQHRVYWTKPDDLPLNPYQPAQGLAAEFCAARADGQVFHISNKLPTVVLRTIFTRSGGEPVPPDVWTNPGASADGWVQLFNHKDRTGWHTATPDAWQVEDRNLVSKGKGFLNSVPRYGDFHCRIKAKINASGSASFGFRSTTQENGSVRISNVIPKERTGSLRFFSKEKLINEVVARQEKELVPPDAWFDLEVIARGKSVTVLVNGKQCAEATIDELAPAGQLHFYAITPETRLQIESIEVRELPASPPAEQWVKLFNAKDLTGWTSREDKYFITKDAAIVANPVSNEYGMLRTIKSFENYELRLQCGVEGEGSPASKARGGIALHVTNVEGETNPKYGAYIWLKSGRDPDIEVHGVGDVGVIKSSQKTKGKLAPPWDELRVVCQGPRITVFYNGEERWSCSRCSLSKGQIGLWSQEGNADFRNIEIRQLSANSPNVPRTAADVLPYLAGIWKLEQLNLDPKSPPDKDPIVGTFAYSFVAGGKFLRGRSSVVPTSDARTGTIGLLDLWSFESDENMLRRWVARSDGWTSKAVSGQFAPASRTLTTHTQVGNNDSIHTYEFIDSSTFNHNIFRTDASGKIISEVHNKWTRVGGPVALPNVPLDPNRPDESKVLDRLVGEWQTEFAVKAVGSSDKPKAEMTQVKAESILGGRFVETIEGPKNYALTWFDAGTTQYRQWCFGSSGLFCDFTGAWNPEAKTMTWKSVSDIAIVSTEVFKSDNRFESKAILRAADGKTLIEVVGTSVRQPRDIPRTAAEVLPFLAGNWKVEKVDVEPKPPPDKAKAAGYIVCDYVAGGAFLRKRGAFETETVDPKPRTPWDQGNEIPLMLSFYDPAKDVLTSWGAWSGGIAYGPELGRFDPKSRSLLWLKTFPGGIRSTHQFNFVDPDTITTRLYNQDETGKIVQELHLTFTRIKGPVTLPNKPADPNRPQEMKVLDRLVGAWRNEATVRNGATPDQPKSETTRSKAESILGGRFIEQIDSDGRDKAGHYSLFWYDPSAKLYRYWFFHSAGYFFDGSGTWDEMTKSLTWNSAGGKLEGRWVFKGDDQREFHHLVKDREGKTHYEATGVSVRQVQDVPRIAADVLPFMAGNWKLEGRTLVPKPAKDAVPTLGLMICDYVADGQFLRARSTGATGLDDVRMLYSFDANQSVLRQWQVWSNESAHGPIIGLFNPDNRTLNWRQKVNANLDTFYTFEFVDLNTTRARIYHQDSNNTIVREWSMTFTRTEEPVTIAGLPTDPKRPTEMKILDQLVGQWRDEVTFKKRKAATPDIPESETQHVKAGHILGGRVIESFITTEPKNTSGYALAWYDVGAKKYRQWLFDGAGKVLEMSGSWDEKEKTLTWTSPDGRLDRRWTFKNDDRREFVNRFIDKRDGPVTEATGVSYRVNSGWIQPFNGKDLIDWRVVGEPTSSWQIRDGILWGSGGQTYLVSRRKFNDFHLKAEYRINPGGRASLLYRADPTDAQLRAQSFHPFGFEVEADSLSKSGYSNRVVAVSSDWERQGTHTYTQPFKADEWLTLDLVVQGDRFTAKAGSLPQTGVAPSLMQTDLKRQSRPGPIILHLGTDSSLFEFRKIEIKEFPRENEPAELKPLRDLVAAKKRIRDIAKIQYQAGKVSAGDLALSEINLLEAEVRLAEAENKSANAASGLQHLLIQWQEVRRVTALLVEVGREPATALVEVEAKIADVKARMAKAGVKPRPEPGDAERLLGRWLLLFGDADNEPLHMDKLDKLEIHFRGNHEVELVRPGAKPERIFGTYEIDPVKKQIRIRPKEVKEFQSWSYRFDGDRLTIEAKSPVLGTSFPGGIQLRMQFDRQAQDKSKDAPDESPIPKGTEPELLPPPREVK
jgi:hypothetical protein